MPHTKSRQPRTHTGAVVIDGRSLTMPEFLAVTRGRRVELSPRSIARLRSSRRLIETAIETNQPVYGVNTGFGELARVSISSRQLDELQVNLIRSHSVGVGQPLGEREVRGMLLLRANSLAAGYSGVRPVLVELLVGMMNAGVLPVVPSQGSVGASGDLAPLAHLAAVVIGEGEASVGGRPMSGRRALQRSGLEPVKLAPKEGLALINGTQLMTAVGLLALSGARAVLAAAEVAAAMSVDALLGSHAPFDARLAGVRPHPGHARVARRLRRLLRGSKINASHRDCGLVQDAYSLRCIPQVLGASLDAIDHSAGVLEIEMNSVTDNPLVFPRAGGRTDGADGARGRARDIVSGGNFHGQPLALALDYMAVAAADMGSFSERRTYRLLDASLSKLPPFLSPEPGTRSGLMVVQYTAAALVSENKVLAHPASVDSIPTCAGTEDHVSMGSISARKAAQVVQNVAHVVAAELICAAQALEIRRPLRSGAGVERAWNLVRQHVAPLTEDRPMSGALATLAALVLDGVFAGIET